MDGTGRLGPWFIGLAMIVCIVGLGYLCQQHSFGCILAFYSPVFLLYLYILRFGKEKNLHFYIGLGIILRLTLIFAFPKLSDDIYRFIWDGHLWMAGINPFEHLPTYYMEEGLAVDGLSRALFERLNSPEYFTIYPPLAQATFATAVWLSPESWWGANLVIKLLLLAFEIGTIWLMWQILDKLDLPKKRVLLYALNPLIIVEITGNLHYEGMMIFFLLLGYWLLLSQKWLAAAAALAGAVAAKLLPLLFMPYLLRRFGWWRSFWFFPILGLFLIALFLPLFNASFIHNFGNSLDLYFRQFEFNGSIYAIARWIGIQQTGYNQIDTIGPTLAMFTIFAVVSTTIAEYQLSWKKLPLLWLFAITVYLAFTPTVHPWYTALPIALCCFTRFRFPILWSGLIFLTYINYSYGEYYENYWIVTLEYSLVVLFLVLELLPFNKLKNFAYPSSMPR